MYSCITGSLQITIIIVLTSTCTEENIVCMFKISIRFSQFHNYILHALVQAEYSVVSVNFTTFAYQKWQITKHVACTDLEIFGLSPLISQPASGIMKLKNV